MKSDYREEIRTGKWVAPQFLTVYFTVPTLLALVLTATLARADDPRRNYVFRSDDGRQVLHVTDEDPWEGLYNNSTRLGLLADGPGPQAWVVTDSISGTTSYEFEADIVGKTAYVSIDGQTIVVVDDRSKEEPAPDLPVLEFYERGELGRSYQLGELFSDRVPVSLSASHFSRLTGRPELTASTITVTTNELASFTFDRATGALLASFVDPRLGDETVFVYGKVRRLGEGRFSVEVFMPLKDGVERGEVIEFDRPETGEARPIWDLRYAKWTPDGEEEDEQFHWGTTCLVTDLTYTLIIENGECIAQCRQHY